MGRTKTTQLKQNVKAPLSTASTSATTPTYTGLELLSKAESILTSSGDVELANSFVERARALCSDSEEDQSRCSEVRGMLALEMGNDEEAKQVSW